MKKLLGKSVYSISQPQLFDKTYEDGKKQFSQLFKNGFIFPEINPAYYAYQIKSGHHVQTGIVVAQAISDFEDGRIKIHEKTRNATRNFLHERLSALRMNFTPIFSFYKDDVDLNSFIQDAVTKATPELEFKTVDGLQHKVWKIDSEHAIDICTERLNKVENIYLADGHHRLSVIGGVMDELNVDSSKRKLVNILFPADQLRLFSFARVLRDIDADMLAQFKYALNDLFEDCNENFLEEGFNFQLFFDGSWRNVKLKDEIKSKYHDNGIGYINALDNEILKNYFSIVDQQEDERILFFKDGESKEIVEQFSSNISADLAIRLKPISIEDIMASADAGLPLPPKSTLFEPKPRSGLFITQI